MIKKSMVKQARQLVLTNRMLILKHTGIIQEDYNEHFFQLGILWAERFTINKEAASLITQSKIYWGWLTWEVAKIHETFLASIVYDFRGRFYLEMEINGKYFFAYGRHKIKTLYFNYMTYYIKRCQSNTAMLEIAFKNTLKPNFNHK